MRCSPIRRTREPICRTKKNDFGLIEDRDVGKE
jgi:hypothetical protein